ncbi:MAG: hypothetical protein IJ786_00035 [Bacteroidaceae bacterium]|nr:hypothetical protein [Bacteroidaceae bacterium]
MKKLITFAALALLAVALPFTIASCGSDDDGESTEKFDKAWFNDVLFNSIWIMDDDSQQFFDGGFDRQGFNIFRPQQTGDCSIFILSFKDEKSYNELFLSAAIKQDPADPWRGTATCEDLFSSDESKDYGIWTWEFALNEDGLHAIDRIILTSPEGKQYSLYREE